MPELANITITSHGQKLEELPTYSGVYRFFSSEETLLYVGKSVDIKARVYSHFQEGRKPGRHQRIMSQVARIEAQATSGEVGALLVENAAIKAETLSTTVVNDRFENSGLSISRARKITSCTTNQRRLLSLGRTRAR